MKNITTEILVIGGGATGTGIVRDLALRGFKSVLVDKADFAQGTTGRYHGLLHSGGRYAVKDPSAAKECIEENRILRRIMPHCIEDTGGFFVLTPEDDPYFSELFVQGCQTAGIPVEEIPISLMLKEEPLLNPQIKRCFRVPDGSADSFLAAHLNVESAKQYGALILNYHKVVSLLKVGDNIKGVNCINVANGEEISIEANVVINASGAWAGEIAAMAGCVVQILPGKGTMVAVNHRIVNTVINRCKKPSDGDILVPAHTVSVIGTTDIKVTNPDRFPIEPWEIKLLLEEGEKIIPGFQSMRMLRAWAGVRPLYQEIQEGGNRDVTRAFALINHQERDGVRGFITITSGKWTTYRKMAEATVDLVCSQLGVTRPCKTHLEPLPSPHEYKYHQLGSRLANIEKSTSYGKIICECELATQNDVVDAIEKGQAKTLDDIRRDTRLGMGPCQAGFCTLRAAGILHQLRHPKVEQTNSAIHDFLQERWKGLLPILWGQQLRQERFNELIYRSLLNAESLPGIQKTNFTPELYEKPIVSASTIEGQESKKINKTLVHNNHSISSSCAQADALIIGAGFSGLMTGLQLSKAGLKSHVITKGWGSTHWHSGCVDILGYEPFGSHNLVSNPADSLLKLIKNNPSHPYALSGIEIIEQAILSLKTLFSNNNYPLHGSLSKNWLLPTALGTLRPTCLAPETMVNGDLSETSNKRCILLVGFSQFVDFYPELAADNLATLGYNTKSITIDIPSLLSRKFVTSRVIAEMFDRFELITEIVTLLKPHIAGVDVIGFPAVLGIQHSLQIQSKLEQELKKPIFEIPTLPPSIPGIRLQHIFIKAIEKNGGRIFEGMQVTDAHSEDQHITHVYSEAAARHQSHKADIFILATGGFLGGGFTLSYNGYAHEPVFSLELTPPPVHSEWFDNEFLSPSGHPLFKTGIAVNHHFQPMIDNHLIFDNLFITGTGLPSFDPLQERSLEGVSLVSGLAISNFILNH